MLNIQVHEFWGPTVHRNSYISALFCVNTGWLTIHYRFTDICSLYNSSKVPNCQTDKNVLRAVLLYKAKDLRTAKLLLWGWNIQSLQKIECLCILYEYLSASCDGEILSWFTYVYEVPSQINSRTTITTWTKLLICYCLMWVSNLYHGTL
jgi:hypothetical protein